LLNVYDAAGNKTTLPLNLTSLIPAPTSAGSAPPFIASRPGDTPLTPAPTPIAPDAPDAAAPEQPKPNAPNAPGNAFVNPFSDVNPSDWFYDDVAYVYTRGLFSGITKDAFFPTAPMQRGMVVTVLGRLYEADPARYKNSGFADVKQNEYYAPYVAWAREMGIVSGMGQNQFAPNANISRQDFICVLSRYAGATGATGAKFRNASARESFADMDDVAAYAVKAIEEFKKGGLISGRPDGRIYPRSEITRAEAASILRRFVERK
jgi:hypothetical protein